VGLKTSRPPKGFGGFLGPSPPPPKKKKF